MTIATDDDGGSATTETEIDMGSAGPPYHCHVNGHIDAGMAALYTVRS